MKVKLFRKDGVKLPEYETVGSAAMDIRALIENGIEDINISHNTDPGGNDSIVINPGGRALIPTGLFPAVPYGYELEIRPRSGLAIKFGITLSNSPGTIDSDYRGQIMIGLTNNGHEAVLISNGERVCQMLLKRVEVIEWYQIMKQKDLGKTDRGAGGFGHTGRN